MSIVNLDAFDWQASLAPECGGNLFDLIWCGHHVLRSPPSLAALREAPSSYGIPVQFPPGRIDGGNFEFERRQYHLPVNEPERNNHLHGLVLSRQWQVTDLAYDSIQMEVVYGEHDAEFTGYPFAFALTLRYRLAPAKVTQTLTVKNCSARTMPCGVGFHTVFTAPKRLRLEALDRRWEILPPRYLATGKLLPLDAFDPRDWFAADQLDFSRQFPAPPGVHAAQLDYGDFVLCYEVDPQFQNWYLWNDHPQSGFIAVEPNSNVSGGFNLALPPAETGLICLAAGETIRLRSQLMIRH